MLELGDYLRIFVRRRWLVLGCTAVVLVVAVLVTVLSSKVYSAQARLFVGTSGTSSNAQLKYAASQYTLQRMASYTELDASGAVLDPVIRELHLHESVRSLDARVTLTNPAGTVILDVSVTGDSPAEAATITNAVADRLSTYIDQLERGSSAPAAALIVVTVTKKAVPNGAVVSPRPVLDLGLGLLVGLILGALLAIVREQFDRSVRTADEGVRIAGLPVLGVVPRVRKRKDLGLRATADAASPSLSRVRSNLSIMFGESPRTLTVLSASGGDGGTTVAVALLAASARGGLRTCLVEADLRRPRMAESLGITAADDDSTDARGTVAGLVDVLLGRSAPDGAALEIATNAWVLPAGRIPDGLDVDALLGSTAFDALLDDLAARYDLVIVDVAPATDTEGLLVARRTQAALLVVRPGASDRQALRATALRVDPSGRRSTGLLFNALTKREARYAERFSASAVPTAELAPRAARPSAPDRAPAPVHEDREQFVPPAFKAWPPVEAGGARPATRRVPSGDRPRYRRHEVRTGEASTT